MAGLSRGLVPRMCNLLPIMMVVHFTFANDATYVKGLLSKVVPVEGKAEHKHHE